MKSIQPPFAYLLGLITGRGHFFIDSKIIAIEFSHTNEFVDGIAHCPVCGWLATDAGAGLVCKNPACGKPVNPSTRKTYNQPEAAVRSLYKVIIPFLESTIQARYGITGNRSMTLLVVDFSDNVATFDEIVSYFAPETSFDRFHIPVAIYKADIAAKTEFVNGLLDTSGFPSPGGWLNRNGENGHGRMRVYFQIVRNWHLPVEIDNYLRAEFRLPVHTIDWGHPNIRDANLKDYFNTRSTSWSREHQIKFFPEYYVAFHFRVSSKQALFEELRDHNLKTVFKDQDDWFPPSRITRGKIKAYHPGEQDLRIPEPARRHFNAFWQINLAMGCKFLAELQVKAKNQECFALTGDAEFECDVATIKREQDKISIELRDVAFAQGAVPAKEKAAKTSTEETLLESSLYEPLSVFLQDYLSKKYKDDVVTFDTSSGNLNLFLKNKNPVLLELFEYYGQYRIRPDIVGFMTRSRRAAFIEAKITPIDIKALGQLLGYCLVAEPEEAILVSTEKVPASTILLLKARPDLLEYAPDKRIQIGVWKNDMVEMVDL